ncbi:MAG: lysophospholipase [Acidimicrobiia bacterium]|nr:lysophospholipase [Acidimicrobiia bacterium]
MEVDEVIVPDPDGLESVVQRWLPDAEPRAVVHIVHGWAEHAARYDRPARALVDAGYAIYADDHRGHGQSGVRSNTLGDLGPRGADGVLDAVHAVTLRAASENPGVPVAVLGHSWGSFILQRYLRRWSDEIDAALLTGTTYRDPAAPTVERPSPNERFEPARTPYDWLSRDEAEVDLYVADPLCGFEIMRSTPTAVRSRDEPQNPAGRRPAASLPVLIFNGADDPIGGEEGGRALTDHYRSLGLTDATFRSYAGARHELFNETNRDDVVADVLAWLDTHL